jgi:hypothetical protein
MPRAYPLSWSWCSLVLVVLMAGWIGGARW